MPLPRSVMLIALVTLAMGFALAVLAGAHQKNARTPRPSQATGGPTRNAPESCPITKAPTDPFVPPSPYRSNTHPDYFWFGTNKLWTQLPKNGTWQGLPQWDDGTFRQKIFWFREGYSWHRDPKPKLEITGQRLDVSATTPLRQLDVASHGWTNDAEHPFLVSGINLPSLGCWKIAARLEDGQLSFVVLVTK
jgi:hypothetical protein